MIQRTCNECGWVAFGVTREFAEREVTRFNVFYNQAPFEIRECYNGPSSIAHYECCNRCGNPYTAFHDSEKDDCPDGCTLNPIIVEGA